MGLFDSLKKLGDDIGKEIEKGIKSEDFQDVKNAVENAAKNAKKEMQSFTTNTTNTKEIPAEYNEFPKFRDTVTDLSTTQTDKYTRCTMNFPNATEQEISDYVSRINSLGYVKGSNVRYDKGNTYIIVDDQYGNLNLVFHIKR